MSGSTVAWIKTASRGSITDVATATLAPIAGPQSNGFMVAVLRSGDNDNLLLRVFDINLNGEIALETAASATAGKVTRVATTKLTTLLANRFVTGVRNHDGKLECIVWDFSSGNSLRKGTVLGGQISAVAVAGLTPGGSPGGDLLQLPVVPRP
jgi:hypothetical protein